MIADLGARVIKWTPPPDALRPQGRGVQNLMSMRTYAGKECIRWTSRPWKAGSSFTSS